MEAAFKAFANFGKTTGDGTQMSLSNSDKWMKQAGVIDGKNVTTTDTAICFNKFKSKTLNFEQFKAFIEALAKEKNLNLPELINKLIKCALPSVAGTTKAVKNAIMQRMTDTSKYTGAHKERFDEAGQGRGLEGRSDNTENTGYVQGYKHKDTYDQKHK